MKRYKIIYFVPDPFTMGRIPVGALVEDGPRVESVIASHLPGAECLGGHKSAALLRMIVRDLAHVTTFELPRSISPHAKLDLEQTLAPQIENPIAWVKQHVLPCKPKQIDGLQDEKLRDLVRGLISCAEVEVACTKSADCPRGHYCKSGTCVPTEKESK